MVDRAYIISEGQVLMEGTPAQIVEDSEVRKVYLGDEFLKLLYIIVKNIRAI